MENGSGGGGGEGDGDGEGDDGGGGDDDDGATQQFDRREHSAHTEDYPSSLSAVRCVLFNARKTGVSHRGVLNGWAACAGGNGKATRP